MKSVSIALAALALASCGDSKSVEVKLPDVFVVAPQADGSCLCPTVCSSDDDSGQGEDPCEQGKAGEHNPNCE